MSEMLHHRPGDRPAMAWGTTADDCRLDEFRAIVESPVPIDCPTADEQVDGVPIYEARRLTDAVSTGDRVEILAELGGVLYRGPGIMVIRGAVEAEAVERASRTFSRIIADQHRAGLGPGDHYAKPGANDRIWNSLEKLALADPEVFVDYHRSLAVDLAAEAWLGPAYQMSAQVNVVNPGGEAQRPHRDYHLGFMTDEQAARYPPHVHWLSPALTLQGAISHCEMSIETGPTKLLPHSHKYGPGYLAWRRPDFIDYFEANHVQLALGIGDALFFSPAVFHAAGTNRTTETRRMANLLQISSVMGRAMERIDRRQMVLALYPLLTERLAQGVDRADVDRVVAVAAHGYPFPGNLDIEQPIDGLAPPSQVDKVRRALDEGWSDDRLASEL